MKSTICHSKEFDFVLKDKIIETRSADNYPILDLAIIRRPILKASEIIAGIDRFRFHFHSDSETLDYLCKELGYLATTLPLTFH